MEIDFKSVRALSSPTRLEMLKNVLENEATPTDLSRDLDKSKSTISSHLSKLENAGLVEKDSEEGRRRVVYHPTKKAQAIVEGKERKVKFSVLSSAVTAIAGAFLGFKAFPENSVNSYSLQESADGMTAAMDTASSSGPETALLVASIGFLTVAIAALLYGLSIRKLGSSGD